MIQKKSLKDAIQNPEIISVVGELIGIRFCLKSSGSAETFNSNIIGMFQVDNLSTSDGLPEGAFSYGVLLTLGSGWFIIQLYFPNRENAGFYIRRIYNSIPDNWEKFPR